MYLFSCTLTHVSSLEDSSVLLNIIFIGTKIHFRFWYFKYLHRNYPTCWIGLQIDFAQLMSNTYHIYKHKNIISDFDTSDTCHTYIEITQCAECNSIPTPSKPHRGQKVIKQLWLRPARHRFRTILILSNIVQKS